VELAAPTARAALLRAEILLEKGEAAAARADADIAVKSDPELAEAYLVRGRAALAAGDKAAAAEDFKRAVEKRPDLKPKVDPLLEKASAP
jgi:Tfp pilus assembly protein PilF